MSSLNINLILAAFVCVCGFIAYAGDLLGRKMGKRRLSLFGLRPRYTAIVITSITGMLIASFSIAMIFGASKDMRVLVYHGMQILNEQRAELKLRKKEASEARKDAVDAGHQRDRLSGDVEQLNAQLKKISTLLRRNQVELARAKEDRNKLLAENKQLSSANAGLRGDLEKNRELLKTAKADFTDTKARLDAAKKDIDLREAKIIELSDEERQLNGVIKDILFSKVIFRPGEEIARDTIKCAQPDEDIRRDLMKILDKAGENAQIAGAKVGSNGRAVRIVTYYKQEDSGNLVTLDESESIDLIIKNISSGSGNIVVRVLSRANSIEGKQASVEVKLNYSIPIYSSGEEVAAATIDGSKSRGEILGDLTLFLRNEVRSAAISKKIIPTYDADGQQSVGGISWDQVLDLVDEVKSSGSKVRVRALAEHDTWSEGPLDIKFEMSKQP